MVCLVTTKKIGNLVITKDVIRVESCNCVKGMAHSVFNICHYINFSWQKLCTHVNTRESLAAWNLGTVAITKKIVGSVFSIHCENFTQLSQCMSKAQCSCENCFVIYSYLVSH